MEWQEDNMNNSRLTGHKADPGNLQYSLVNGRMMNQSFFTNNAHDNYSVEDGCNFVNYRVAFHQSSDLDLNRQGTSSTALPHDSTSSVAPRVYVNPNYRPKSSIRSDKDFLTNRPSNVHVNPHWRGRQESNSIVGSDLQTVKKTIFVNPKVLASMKNSNSQSSTESTDSSASLQLGQKKSSESKHQSSWTQCFETQVACAQEKNLSSLDPNESAQAVLEEKPAYVILSSTKLIRRAQLSSFCNAQNQKKVSDLKYQPCNPTQWSTEATSKRNCNAASIKLAKQVSSKYKLVRNQSLPQSASKNASLSIISGRKLRRKSSPKVTLPIKFSSKSIYRFVRGAGSTEIYNKMPSFIPPATANSVMSGNSQRSNVRGRRNSVAAKKMRSQYKLIKVQSTDLKKMKVPQSRYKVMNTVTPDYRSYSTKSWKKQDSRLLQSPFVRSRFKISRKASSSGMIDIKKISRFPVIPSLGTFKLRTSLNHWKHSKNFSFVNPSIQKPGFYGNKTWLKEQPAQEYPHLLSAKKLTFKGLEGDRLSAKKSSNRSLLNIGGVLYRSTGTTLTRTKPGKPKEKVLHIRGQRFVLDSNGTTLRPSSLVNDVPYPKWPRTKDLSLSRIDIGGVTFVRKSGNTLVRTNSHYARNLLSIARTRSIALLRDKLRKNNQPCLIYHRFGKCHAYQEGKCWRVHDPKRVSVCKKFLQGSCETKDCLLSHNVGPEKMPTCRYFLEGCCVRDNCPYLHVKLSANAGICRDFIQGYCAAADKCKRRHMYICPDYDLHAKCEKGKYCPYPHPINTINKMAEKKAHKHLESSASKKAKAKSMSTSKEDHTSSNGEINRMKRYYDKSKCDKLDSKSERESLIESTTCNSETSKSESQADSNEDSIISDETSVFPRRPKIGILPAFIPLE